MNDPIGAGEPDVRSAARHLRSVMIPSETLEAWAVQRRIFSLTHRRVLVAATSGRLISIARRLIGGYDVEDIRWQDLEEVALKVGVLGADLSVRAGKAADLASEGAGGSRRLEFAGLRKEEAQAVYRVCQAQDQAWREKRRIRELDELRARSGGIHLASPMAGGAPGVVADPVRRLQEAKQMLDARLITDAEYEAIKARIVSMG
jgi:hypothetical protein